VGEVAKACRKYDLELGLYYSLWDRREPTHADSDPRKYQDFMFAQLDELMSNYGPICELWLDGAWGKPKDEDWNIPELYERVTKLQPDCVVCVNHTVEIPGEPRKVRRPADMQEGDPLRFWPVDLRLLDPNLARADDPQIYTWKGEPKRLPFEHTVCLSDQWTWFQKKGGTTPRPVDELELLFFWCTRGDASLIINVPPDETGRLRPEDEARMLELADRLGIRGGGALPREAPNLLFGASVSASSELAEHPASFAVDTSLERFWAAEKTIAELEVIPSTSVLIDRILLVEAPVDERLADGFTTFHEWRIEAFEVDVLENGLWKCLSRVGRLGPARFIDLEKPIKAEGFRLRITAASAPPRIAHVGACLRAEAGLRPNYLLP
jgi:alpha-L-fucosidase